MQLSAGAPRATGWPNTVSLALRSRSHGSFASAFNQIYTATQSLLSPSTLCDLRTRRAFKGVTVREILMTIYLHFSLWCLSLAPVPPLTALEEGCLSSFQPLPLCIPKTKDVPTDRWLLHHPHPASPWQCAEDSMVPESWNDKAGGTKAHSLSLTESTGACS